jgi:fermentation-respiration switch protein FrsA (DUF1100 family)
MIFLLLKLVYLILIAGVIFSGCLYLAQGKLIFQGSREMNRDPGDAGYDFEEFRLPVAGYETHGWYVPLQNHRGVVLFSHGNAGNLSGRIESIGLLRSFGFSVLAYDYGGYGFSSGKPSEKRCYADIRAMWDYLVKVKQIPPSEIVLFGRSLGAAPTAELAQSVTPGAVVLESAFLSVPDVAKDMPIVGHLTWLIRHRFENKHKVAKITSPVLFVHSPDDEVIPFTHGQRLFELAPEHKTFLEIRGDHNMGFVISEPVYRPGWEAFLVSAGFPSAK